MKPVVQQVHDKNTGDCMAACVASILELPLEEVPNFRAQAFADNDECNTKYLMPWLARRGLSYITISRSNFAFMFFWDEVYALFGVPSQRFEGGEHYVVGRLGRINGKRYQAEISHDPQKLNLRPYTWNEVTQISFIIAAGVFKI